MSPWRTMLPTLYAGANFVLHSAGWLEAGLAAGYAKFMMDADQIAMLQRFAGNLDLSEEARAMEAIREVGPGGHYLGCAHTQRNFKTAFYTSQLADNNSYEQWEAEGSARPRPAGVRGSQAASRPLRAAGPRSRHRRSVAGFHRPAQGRAAQQRDVRTGRENKKTTEAQRHREGEEKTLGPLRGPICFLSSLCLCG